MLVHTILLVVYICLLVLGFAAVAVNQGKPKTGTWNVWAVLPMRGLGVYLLWYFYNH